VDRDLDWDLTQDLSFIVFALIGGRDDLKAEVEVEGLAEDVFDLGFCHLEDRSVRSLVFIALFNIVVIAGVSGLGPGLGGGRRRCRW
jgi:hypothetical protein